MSRASAPPAPASSGRKIAIDATRLREMVATGMSDAEIAAALGCSGGTVWARRREHGILTGNPQFHNTLDPDRATHVPVESALQRTRLAAALNGKRFEDDPRLAPSQRPLPPAWPPPPDVLSRTGCSGALCADAGDGRERAARRG